MKTVIYLASSNSFLKSFYNAAVRGLRPDRVVSLTRNFEADKYLKFKDGHPEELISDTLEAIKGSDEIVITGFTCPFYSLFDRALEKALKYFKDGINSPSLWNCFMDKKHVAQALIIGAICRYSNLTPTLLIHDPCYFPWSEVLGTTNFSLCTYHSLPERGYEYLSSFENYYSSISNEFVKYSKEFEVYFSGTRDINACSVLKKYREYANAPNIIKDKYWLPNESIDTPTEKVLVIGSIHHTNQPTGEKYFDMVAKAKRTAVCPSYYGEVATIRLWQALSVDTLPCFHECNDMDILARTFPKMTAFAREHLMFNDWHHIKDIDYSLLPEFKQIAFDELKSV